MQARNQPKEPPKQPAQAPFFLPTVPGLSGQPDFGAPQPEAGRPGAAQPQSRVVSGAVTASSRGALVKALHAEAGCAPVIHALAQLAPLELDRQLRAMLVRLPAACAFSEHADHVLAAVLLGSSGNAGSSFATLQRGYVPILLNDETVWVQPTAAVWSMHAHGLHQYVALHVV